MGDEGEIWNRLKEIRRKKKRKYEAKISPTVQELIAHPECREVGDHWRILGEHDFWWTGTVYNIKTKKRTSVQKLLKLLKQHDNKN